MRRSRFAAYVGSLLLALAAVLTGTGTAHAAEGPYVALGDSYSSSFAFRACSGGRTGEVRANRLTPLSSATALVSISIGGNDAGFADVMTTCVLQSDSSCLSRINTAKAYVDSTLPGQLDNVYSAISSRAPNAHVVVLGYPRFYKLGTTCLGLSETKRKAINDAADYLDTAINKAAANHGFAFVDVRTTFTGRCRSGSPSRRSARRAPSWTSSPRAHGPPR